MSGDWPPPDSLFVFERLAALERSLSGKTGDVHRIGTDPVRAELEQALREVARLRRALEIVAGLPVGVPDTGPRAIRIARAALADEPVPPAR